MNDRKSIDNLISALTWIVVHGNDDNNLSCERRSKKALHEKVICACAFVSLWVSSLLNKLGVRNRLVSGMTLDKWNSYDNGHTMLEVYLEDIDQWQCYDLSNHATFHSNDHYLNFYELCDAVCNDRAYEISYLSSSVRYECKSKYAMIYEKTSGESNLREWYRRVLQVPMIMKEGSTGEFYYYDCNIKKKLESYTTGFRYMEKDDFMSCFYQYK